MILLLAASTTSRSISGVIHDVAGNDYAGISGRKAFNFTTDSNARLATDSTLDLLQLLGQPDDPAFQLKVMLEASSPYRLETVSVIPGRLRRARARQDGVDAAGAQPGWARATSRRTQPRRSARTW